MVEPAEIQVDIEGETVHRSATGQPNPDRREFPRPLAVGLDPHPRVPVEPACLDAELGDRVDDDLLDGRNVGDGVGHAAAPFPSHREHRIPDELPGAMKRDVAATVHPVECCANGGRIDEDVLFLASHAQRVGGGMLTEQEMVLLAFEKALLEIPALGVVDSAEPTNAKRFLAAHRCTAV